MVLPNSTEDQNATATELLLAESTVAALDGSAESLLELATVNDTLSWNSQIPLSYPDYGGSQSSRHFIPYGDSFAQHQTPGPSFSSTWPTSFGNAPGFRDGAPVLTGDAPVFTEDVPLFAGTAPQSLWDLVNPVQPHYPVSEQAFNLDPELWPPPVDSSMTLADLQRLDDSSLSEMPNFVPEPFVENSFQAGGLNVAQTAPNSVRLISSSPARIPWSNNTHALPNVSYQTYSDSSWEHLSRFQPTPESYDTSTFSMVPSQQPSRDPSHSSRSPNNPTSNLTYNGTPPTALIVVEDSVLPALASGLVSEVEPQALPIEQSATKKRSKKPKAAPKAVAHSPQQSATTLSKGKRKGAMSEPGREKAKDVRRVGSCVRCRMYHLGCDTGNPCTSCSKVEDTYRIWSSPCYREDITNVLLVRTGSGKSGEMHMKFKDYMYITPNDAPKRIEIKWQLPMKQDITLPTWTASVHEFIPRDGIDLIHEEWQINGETHVLELPPWAAYDTAGLKRDLGDFIEQCRPAMQELMLETVVDELSLSTFQEAIRYSEVSDSELIRLALRVRTTSLLSAGWGSIVGEDTLGIPRVDGANAAFCGDTPTPVPLAHQFDVVFITAMYELEREVVKGLKKKLFQKDPKPWYEIFLTYFIMVTHLQFTHSQAMAFVKVREQTKSAGGVSFINKSMIAKWEYSAGNMLQHYRLVLRGFLPFAVARKDPEEVRKKGHLDEESLGYIEKANQLLSSLDALNINSNGGKPSLDEEKSWIRALFREQY